MRGLRLLRAGGAAHLLEHAGRAGVAGGSDGSELGGGRSSAGCGRGAAARFRANEEHGQRLRGSRNSTRCSYAALAHRNDDGDIRGGGKFRRRWGTELEHEREQGRRGNQSVSSQRLQRWPRRARGSTGASGAARGISGGRRRR